MAPLTLKVDLNGVHRIEGGGVIGDTWPSLSLKPPERQCEVLGSGGGKAEGPRGGTHLPRAPQPGPQAPLQLLGSTSQLPSSPPQLSECEGPAPAAVTSREPVKGLTGHSTWLWVPWPDF